MRTHACPPNGRSSGKNLSARTGTDSAPGPCHGAGLSVPRGPERKGGRFRCAAWVQNAAPWNLAPSSCPEVVVPCRSRFGLAGSSFVWGSEMASNYWFALRPIQKQQSQHKFMLTSLLPYPRKRAHMQVLTSRYYLYSPYLTTCIIDALLLSPYSKNHARTDPSIHHRFFLFWL
jgi:hypothetical protein